MDLSFFVKNNKKRVKTVLVPFVLWCIVWFLIMYNIQLVPGLKNYFSTPLHSLTLSEQVKQMFYYPLNYPFWFLRELLILFIITPFIFILCKYLKYWVLLFLSALLVFNELKITIYELKIITAPPLFYFTLGAFISLNKIPLVFRVKSGVVVLFFLCWIFLNVLYVLTEINYLILPKPIGQIFVIKDLIGCIAVWCLYDLINQKNQWENYNFYQYSFFIFAFHGIPTLLLVQLSIRLFENNPLYLFLSYVAIIIIIIIMSIMTAKLTQRVLPNIYRILTGNRI